MVGEKVSIAGGSAGQGVYKKGKDGFVLLIAAPSQMRKSLIIKAVCGTACQKNIFRS